MQVLIGPALTSGEQNWDAGRDAFAGLGVPSVESQLRLRELYVYLETCRTNLKEIRRELSLFESGPDNTKNLEKAAQRLGAFCIEADSWGFSALYEIGLSLQLLLLNSGGNTQRTKLREALNRGLETMSVLIEQCGSDFRRRLTVADTLDCINEAYRSQSS